MSGSGRTPVGPAGIERVEARRILVRKPVVRIGLGPGARALVGPGDRIEAGTPIAERTIDVEVVDAGRQPGPESVDREDADSAAELPEGTPPSRRTPPEPGKWWVGGAERRGKPQAKNQAKKQITRVAGTLLYETHDRWRAAAGERHEVVESPVAGVVRQVRPMVDVALEASGTGISAEIGAGDPSRGYLDVPRLADGELWASALDVGKSGAVVVAGSRISSQAISRARAVSIRGLIAGSIGEVELRDLAASLSRQRAGFASSVSFGLVAFDGYQRRVLATPILALLTALAGQEVGIVTDPPMIVFAAETLPLPELAADWVRARSGPNAGREGRWIESLGLRRFRSGMHLEAAAVRFGEDADATIVPITDLERFVY